MEQLLNVLRPELLHLQPSAVIGLPVVGLLVPVLLGQGPIEVGFYPVLQIVYRLLGCGAMPDRPGAEGYLPHTIGIDLVDIQMSLFVLEDEIRIASQVGAPEGTRRIEFRDNTHLRDRGNVRASSAPIAHTVGIGDTRGRAGRRVLPRGRVVVDTEVFPGQLMIRSRMIAG